MIAYRKFQISQQHNLEIRNTPTVFKFHTKFYEIQFLLPPQSVILVT